MDNRGKKLKLGRSRINLDKDVEVKCWTKHLGVSRQDLERAVGKVGNSASAVRKELSLVGNIR